MLTLITLFSILGGSVILTIAFFLLASFFSHSERTEETFKAFGIMSTVLATVAGVPSIVLSIAAAASNNYIEERRAQYEVQREVLVYRLENRDPYIVEALELYNEVLEFNSGIAHAKSYANDPWVGLFVDKAWLGIEEIDLHL